MAGQWQCSGAGMMLNPPDTSGHIKAHSTQRLPFILQERLSEPDLLRRQCPCTHEWNVPWDVPAASRSPEHPRGMLPARKRRCGRIRG